MNRADILAMRDQITLTRIVETSVFGAKAYHAECECGFKSQRRDREARAVKDARAHGEEKHA